MASPNSLPMGKFYLFIFECEFKRNKFSILLTHHVDIIKGMDPENNAVQPQDAPLPAHQINQAQGVQPHQPADPRQQQVPKHEDAPTINDNDYAVIYQSEKYMKLVPIRAGDRFQTTEGAYKHNDIVNQPWGQKIAAFNKPGQYVCALKPKSTLITETLARKTQILYCMDNSAILFKLSILPGQTVVEAGTGSGSLSCAFSQVLGESGRLYTFQFNKQRAEITKEFFISLKKDNITSTWRDVCAEGFGIEGIEYKADALFLDVPNPWAAITHAKNTLKRHGRICCFSPCIEQVQKTCEELRKQKFKKVETFECLSREYEIDGADKQIFLEGIESVKRMRSISRAVHNNRGHTGFLVFAVSC